MTTEDQPFPGREEKVDLPAGEGESTGPNRLLRRGEGYRRSSQVRAVTGVVCFLRKETGIVRFHRKEAGER
jgi:hypothetical protein